MVITGETVVNLDWCNITWNLKKIDFKFFFR